MSSKEELLKKLEHQFEVELMAREKYASFLLEFKDEKIRRPVDKIRNDETMHMNAVREMISIVENYEKNLLVQPAISPPLDEFRNALKKSNSIIALGSVENYTLDLIHLIKTALSDKTLLYISYNRIPSYIKEELREHGADLNKIVFISCTRQESGDDISIDPSDLTNLSIAIHEMSQKTKELVIIVDALSSFAIFHDISTICKFMSSVNTRAAKDKFSIIWVFVGEDKSFLSKIGPLCNQTIKLK